MSKSTTTFPTELQMVLCKINDKYEYIKTHLVKYLPGGSHGNDPFINYWLALVYAKEYQNNLDKKDSLEKQINKLIEKLINIVSTFQVEATNKNFPIEFYNEFFKDFSSLEDEICAINKLIDQCQLGLPDKITDYKQISLLAGLDEYKKTLKKLQSPKNELAKINSEIARLESLQKPLLEPSLKAKDKYSAAELYQRGMLLYYSHPIIDVQKIYVDQLIKDISDENLKQIIKKNKLSEKLSVEDKIDEDIRSIIKSDRLLQKLFVENNEIKYNKNDQKYLLGLGDLFESAKQGYLPAKLNLATTFYRSAATEVNGLYPDRAEEYYRALRYFIEGANEHFAPAEVELIALLIDTPPIRDEKGNYYDAKKIIDRCKKIPLTKIHDEYAKSMDMFTSRYNLLKSAKRNDQRALLGEVAFRLAMNYFDYANQLKDKYYDKDADVILTHAHEQLQLAIDNNHRLAMQFKAYLIGKSPIGLNILNISDFAILVKNSALINKSEITFDKSNHLASYTKDMTAVFNNAQDLCKDLISLEKKRPQLSQHNQSKDLAPERFTSIIGGVKQFATEVKKTTRKTMGISFRFALTPSLVKCTTPFIFGKENFNDFTLHPEAAVFDKKSRRQSDTVNKKANKPSDSSTQITPQEAFTRKLKQFDKLKKQENRIGLFKTKRSDDYEYFLLKQIIHKLNISKDENPAQLKSEINKIVFRCGKSLC
ncbi:MAG: hypothetical protein ACK4PR_09065, partial [Gammaproteobacteria bacterium]